jgi:hypothetical protein
MGESKRRKLGVAECIYCQSRENLSDEHVLPYGLGGTLVLSRASCLDCASKTGKLEQRLLRGHWWPYRKKLSLQTRNPTAQAAEIKVSILKTDGPILTGHMPLDSNVAAMVFYFDPPSILLNVISDDIPFAKSVNVKMLGLPPSEAKVDGKRYLLSPFDRVEFPVNFHAPDLARFLAKVAHGYAISKLGLAGFSTLFLPKYILGLERGLLTYVGGYHTALRLPFFAG